MAGRRVINRPWADDEIERLKAMATRGESALRAAAALKRSVSSIRAKARDLGTPFQTIRAIRKKWADTPSDPWRRY